MWQPRPQSVASVLPWLHKSTQCARWTLATHRRRRVLAGGRDAGSPEAANIAQREMERQLRKDALRKRVMMRMIPNPEQVCACMCWYGVRGVPTKQTLLTLRPPVDSHPAQLCLSYATALARALQVIGCLQKGDMLPAIWFILSRVSPK